jgi:pimeloyl-ACP methyl ester carboxylesterase
MKHVNGRGRAPRAAFRLLSQRIVTDTTITFDPGAIGADPAAYLRQGEARLPDIRSGLQKEIVWHDPTRRARTPLAIVYVHGLAASKEETRPVADEVARAAGANLFYTRLTGHGLPSAALAGATINHWINDVAEAMEIGRRIGERVLVMATSTGAALTASLALEETAASRGLGALVMMSPNFRPPSPLMTFASTPAGAMILSLMRAGRRAAAPADPALAHAWTKPVPICAVQAALAASHLVYRADVARAAVPTLFIYSQRDRVVFPKETDRLFEAWGGDKERFLVTGSRNPTQHVIAGRLRSPETTEAVIARIVDWMQRRGLGARDGCDAHEPGEVRVLRTRAVG